MPVTKRLFPRRQYHEITASGLLDSGVWNNEIIDVINSLGHPGNTLTISTPAGGGVTVRLNVCEKIHQRQTYENPHIVHAGFYVKPLPIDEIEVLRDDLVVPASTNWTHDDNFSIADFKIVDTVSGVVFRFE